MKKYFLFILIILTEFPAQGPSFRAIFIIWNIGQGQWLTAIQDNRCDHFDFGGEKFPLNKIKHQCFEKQNHLHLSHWDYDHWGGLKKLTKIVPNICHKPWPSLHEKKRLPESAAILSACKNEPAALWFGPEKEILNKKGLTSNDFSQVFIYQNRILIPGDSTLRMEKIWASPSMGLNKKQIRILILGHHGSKTSTSENLLQNLPHLKLAIASARKSRYGHPHFVVTGRLQHHRIPILTTEDWGHIGLEL
jgi:competence protein ComEC